MYHGGGGGGNTRTRGGTGRRATIRLEPQLVEMIIRAAAIGEDSLADAITIGDFTSQFHGNDFSDTEHLVALQAFRDSHPVHNVMGTYCVSFTPSGTGSTARIIIFNIVANANTSSLDIFKIGTPTSTLPNDSEAQTITTRLTGYNISLSGFNDSNERKAALMSMNAFADTELDKVRGLSVVRRTNASSSTHGEDREAIGGEYNQTQHQVEIYNRGYVEGLRLAYGTNTGAILPGVVAAIFHEVGHAIAYSGIRQLGRSDSEARQRYDSARSQMRTRWPDYYSESGEGDSFTYRYENPRNVPDDQRAEYQSDLARLRETISSAESANRAYTQATESPMMISFGRTIRRLTPVTPYSKRVAEAASDDASRLAAAEEFFAEAYAVYKTYPDWLRDNRRAVYDFFSQDQHLR